MKVKYPPFSHSKCDDCQIYWSTSSLWIQAVSTDQVKEAGQEETEEVKSEEDQTADEPKQKVAQINSATNVMVFGYKYTFEKNFLKNVDGLQEENMDAQGNLMKRVDSENQVEKKMRLNQISWTIELLLFLQLAKLERAESFCMDLMESGRNAEVRNQNFLKV